jgi:aminoglycoside phosphotransferase (APT) family kinase protein
MVRTKMHADEVATDPRSVRRLLLRQFPQWATLPLALVESYGTDHDIYRLGEHLAVRLPRIGGARDQASKEARWLPGFAPQLPLALPVPVALGEPDEGHPFPWGVYEWLPGDPAHAGVLRDREEAAADLAAFIAALHRIDTAGAPDRPPGSRGGPLVERDGDVRRSIAELGNRIDGAAALRCWESSLSAPTWNGRDVWIHGDLLPGNLLAVHGRLSAVIDFGALTVGDPACDLLPAWNMFEGSSRRTFLDELQVEEASRLRGRGWVLSQALVALPYYWVTNPPMVRQALHAVAHVLADAKSRT